MDEKEKATVLEGLRLIGQYGREAREMIEAALKADDLDSGHFAEAQAQLDDVQF